MYIYVYINDPLRVTPNNAKYEKPKNQKTKDPAICQKNKKVRCSSKLKKYIFDKITEK